MDKEKADRVVKSILKVEKPIVEFMFPLRFVHQNEAKNK